MPYRITEIKVNGIRGFNKPEEVHFGEGLTLLYGKNGSGKSSILQAIEWGITGRIPYMKGGDFAREDAIVNMFTRSKKGTVEVHLQDGQAPISLQRTRKMAKTSGGKPSLELKIGDKTVEDEEAHEELEKILGISLDAFQQSKYLHQETLREILQAGPEDRSKAIDKLLGTFEVREFAKTIDMDKQVKSSATTLQDTINSLKKDKVQFLINLKRSLEETRQKLLSQGTKEDDLTLAATIQKLEHSRLLVEKLIKTYQAKPLATLTIKPDVESLIDAHRLLQSQSNSLDRSRLEAINRINLRKTRLRTDSTRYGEVHNQLNTSAEKDPDKIQSQINTIDGELEKAGSEIRALGQKLVTLPHKREIYETGKARLGLEQEKLDGVITKNGTIEEIQSKIEKGETEQKTILSELGKLDGQQRLISMAIKHLKETGAKTCPVCSSDVDNQKLVAELQTKVSDEITSAINNLNQSQAGIKAQKNAFEDAIDEQKRLAKSLKTVEDSLRTAKVELARLVPDFEEQDLDAVAKGWDVEIRTVSDRESVLRGEQAQLKDLLRRLTKLLEEITSLEADLQKETSSSLSGSVLLKKVDSLILSLDDEISGLSDSSEVDALRKTLSELPDVLTYLRDEERMTEAEKQLPQVEEQMRKLEERKSSLQALAASLQSIKQVAQQYQKEESTRQLKRLEDEINNYYSKIQGHPYFTQIKIDIEKEDPLTFSFRAASSQDDTYIPTRFSTAQFNSAALSIFMSNCKQQAGELPLMIFDDPTQNMDTSHKESFAKLVSTLTPGFQIIIATEDDEVRELLEKNCEGLKAYELGEWTTEGPQIMAK
jgi:DNA repair exonuclease SbcCD ATPase subunit